MLPILRLLPVGGVFLAILVLALALKTPETRHPTSPVLMTARGPLIDRDDNPEWRQVLVRAALRRADELMRLRDLPDAPVATAPVAEPSATTETIEWLKGASEKSATPPVEIAGRPVGRADSDPDPESADVTGSITEAPATTLPIDIGATSSTELPVITIEQEAPVIRTPAKVKSGTESRRKRLWQIRRARLKAQQQATKPPETRSFFEILFGMNTPATTTTSSKNAAVTTAAQWVSPR